MPDRARSQEEEGPSIRSVIDPASSRGCQECPYLRVFKANVFVRDQDRSLEFYVGQLGFSLVADAALDLYERWVAVAPPDGSTVLALLAPKPGTENYRLIG